MAKTSKRRFGRRRRRSRKKRKIGFRRACVPTRMVAKLRYADHHQITWGSVLTENDYIYRANSLFDPDLTGSGHQPRGFDQYMQMYDHYTVVGAKCTVTFTNESTSNASMPIVCAVALTDNNIPITAKYSDIMERADINSGVIAHPEGGNATCKRSVGFGAKKFFGRTNIMDNDDLKGDAVSNPAEQAYFHILNSISALSTDRGVNLGVVIDYLVVFTEPKQPGES